MDYRLPVERMKDVNFGEGIREIAALADAMQRDGRDVIHLELGRPDLDSPECAKSGQRDIGDGGRRGGTFDRVHDHANLRR